MHLPIRPDCLIFSHRNMGVYRTSYCLDIYQPLEKIMFPFDASFSDLGRSLIDEMNRLGVIVDLSHMSDAAVTQALNHSKAPVIWSHSAARAVHNVSRNIPDNILKLIGTGEGQKDGVIMVSESLFHVLLLLMMWLFRQGRCRTPICRSTWSRDSSSSR